MTPLQLHVPDEPSSALPGWRARLSSGDTVDDVLGGDEGVADWYWHRWRALEHLGVGRDEFDAIVAGHRRELGLWLRGERTHASVASSLAGRVARRQATRRGAGVPRGGATTTGAPARRAPGCAACEDGDVAEAIAS